MLSKDHRLLGRVLVRQMFTNKSPLAAHLFVTGCVFPDHNPWTYLRGVSMGHPLKTHFLFLSYSEILRLCVKLENRTRLYLWDYYTLGVLLHYAADAFTFPHNPQYRGTMIGHACYERKLLHPALESYLRGHSDRECIRQNNREPLAAVFEKLHASYRKENEKNGDPVRDAAYICRICTIICGRILEKEQALAAACIGKKERIVRI